MSSADYYDNYIYDQDYHGGRLSIVDDFSSVYTNAVIVKCAVDSNNSHSVYLVFEEYNHQFYLSAYIRWPDGPSY